ncbi:3-keto-5-aminohexanoate cleavage protein [Novosphingobium beihaiensis]|uniref:3-keto-5-aminohexanoate cleavage protein n=1 Tax=Novosphingobium beihaiensis TaxID=2930389 RepID=A0ABT0BU76_9SPHN|nr:3-keto-5-aminohexanoate cleavage protein [Novosphingobium beihaiensis]MCJ2188448.1 3-keto-5-aminohexanoate cleavage protein [Novosphingobium beihaiensis]
MNATAQQEVPSLWEAARQESEGYGFLGNYEQPKWDIPEAIGISCAVSNRFGEDADQGASVSSIEQYIDEASAVIEEGVCSVHIDFTWVTDKDGRRLDQIPPVEAYQMVLEPLRKRYGYDFIADLNVLNGKTFEECMSPAVAGLAEIAPCAPGHPEAFVGPAVRTLFANGVLPALAIHNSGEIELTKRRLIDTGIMTGPVLWGLLFGLPFDIGRTLLSGNCVMDTDDMIRQMMLMIHQIRKLNPEAQILVCAAGRATMYMTTLATMLGLHIRIGTEDTQWKYPNSNEQFTSNIEMLKTAKEIAALHGRRPATANEMRQMLGMQPR